MRDYSRILNLIRASDDFGANLRDLAMRHLADLPGYNWCGIYRLEGSELVLDEYTGAETDHTRIPVGRGVCGTAVAEDKNQIVPDVTSLDNYLACSLTTKSEIVVLIRKEGCILGQIDIDGHEIDAFHGEDEEFLESVANLLAARW